MNAMFIAAEKVGGQVNSAAKIASTNANRVVEESVLIVIVKITSSNVKRVIKKFALIVVKIFFIVVFVTLRIAPGAKT